MWAAEWRKILVAGLLFLPAVTADGGAFAPGSGLLLTPEELANLEAHGHVVELDGVKKYIIGDQLYVADEIRTQAFQGRPWTGGTIYYAFSPAVAANPDWQANFVVGCVEWSSKVPNVRCLERLSERNFVEVRTHVIPRCVSYSETTGMKTGRQVLSIYHDPAFDPARPVDGCREPSHWPFIYVIAHEIGHVFGLVHEQSRWDRNSYVNLIAANLERPNDPNVIYQFRVVAATKSTSYTPYDFVSIMHYSATAFAKAGKRTLVPSTCYVGEVDRIGSRGLVTVSDALELRHHYGAPIYELLKRERNAACGVERVNAAERKHFCDDLKEACGPGAAQALYSGKTGHSTWWCPGGFAAACGGASGPHRSCCGNGKVPIEVRHGRGSRECSLYTRRKHDSSWTCACEYYLIDARCPTSEAGWDSEAVDEFARSGDPQRRVIGRLLRTVLQFLEQGLVEPQALSRLEDVLLKDFGRDAYFRALAQSEQQIRSLRTEGVITPAHPLLKNQLFGIIESNVRREIAGEDSRRLARSMAPARS